MEGFMWLSRRLSIEVSSITHMRYEIVIDVGGSEHPLAGSTSLAIKGGKRPRIRSWYLSLEEGIRVLSVQGEAQKRSDK